MNMNSTSRTRDSTEVVSTLIANLAELTKSYYGSNKKPAILINCGICCH